MNKKLTIFIIMLAVFALGISELTAQRGTGRGRNAAERNYNPATVVVLKGTVTDVTTIDPWGLHISLKTKNGTIGVHLGPESFLNGKMSISKGDVVIVAGSKVNISNQDVIIAKSIQKNGKKIILRDDAGTPEWAGQGRRKNIK